MDWELFSQGTFDTCGPLNCEHTGNRPHYPAVLLKASRAEYFSALKASQDHQGKRQTTDFHLVATIFTKAHIEMNNALAVKHCPMWLFTKTAQPFQILISVLCLCVKLLREPSWFLKGLIPKCHISPPRLGSSVLQGGQNECKPSMDKNL